MGFYHSKMSKIRSVTVRDYIMLSRDLMSFQTYKSNSTGRYCVYIKLGTDEVEKQFHESERDIPLPGDKYQVCNFSRVSFTKFLYSRSQRSLVCQGSLCHLSCQDPSYQLSCQDPICQPQRSPSQLSQERLLHQSRKRQILKIFLMCSHKWFRCLETSNWKIQRNPVAFYSHQPRYIFKNKRMTRCL